jgi:hypothetical protein
MKDGKATGYLTISLSGPQLAASLFRRTETCSGSAQ